jgi:hypothetical protein
VTLLNSDYDWWVGTRNIEALFGKKINLDAMRDVRVQTLIGTEDNLTWEIAIPRDSAFWMDGADLMGENRLDRIEALAKSFETQGIRVRRDAVAGVAHEPFRVIEPAEAFFTDVVQGRY